MGARNAPLQKLLFPVFIFTPFLPAQIQQIQAIKAPKPESILEFNHNLSDNDLENIKFETAIKFRIRTTVINSDRLKFNFSLADNLTNEIERLDISNLSYRLTLIEQKLTLTFSLIGNEISSNNPLLNQPNIDFTSRFSRKNPLYRLVENGGITLDYKVSEQLSLTTAYYAGELREGNHFNNFFQGDSSWITQVKVKPNEEIYLGLVYIYTNNNSNLRTRTGSQRSQLNLQRALTSHSYGLETAFQVTPHISLGGWLGFTNATIHNLGEAYIVNYAVNLGIANLQKKGDFLGIIIGQEPKLTGTNGVSIDGRQKDKDTSLSTEVLYHYPLTKDISLTPSFIWITAPDHNASNRDNFIFTIRTKIRF